MSINTAVAVALFERYALCANNVVFSGNCVPATAAVNVPDSWVTALTATGPTVCDGVTVQDVPEPAVIFVPAVTPTPVIVWPIDIVPAVTALDVNVTPEIDAVNDAYLLRLVAL